MYALQQQQQQQQQLVPQAYQPAAAAPQLHQPGANPIGMCLFRDGKPDYDPSHAAAAIKSQLANSYWAPCPITTSGSPAAPAGVPLGTVPPSAAAAPAAPPTADAAASAAVSGTAVSAASTAAAEPVQSMAAIRSPEAFVKAEGPATQVCCRPCVWIVF
jgi:hypothetical protein